MLSGRKKMCHDFGLWSKMTPIGNEWEIEKNTKIHNFLLMFLLFFFIKNCF